MSIFMKFSTVTHFSISSNRYESFRRSRLSITATFTSIVIVDFGHKHYAHNKNIDSTRAAQSISKARGICSFID